MCGEGELLMSVDIQARNASSSNSTQIIQLVKYNVCQHPLYDPNNIDVALNAIAAVLQKGDTVYLPYGDYYFSHTIDFSNLPMFCDINLQGRLRVSSSVGVAIKLGGSYFKFYLNVLNSALSPLSDYSNMVDIGIQYGAGVLSNADVYINNIFGFDTGIGITPSVVNSVVNYVQYVRTTFNRIYNCTHPILFNIDNDSNHSCHANENAFHGGQISGYTGITMMNGLGFDGIGYNNNKFYDIGFEGITGNALDMSNAYYQGNGFINCRMLESIGGVYIVDNSPHGNKNLYIFSHINSVDKINVTSINTKYLGPLSLVAGGACDFNGFTVGANGIKKYDITNFHYTAITSNTTLLPNAGIPLINTSTSTVIITLPIEWNVEGTEKLLKISNYTNNITILNSDSSTAVASGVINAVGYWKLIYINMIWYCFKIVYANSDNSISAPFFMPTTSTGLCNNTSSLYAYINPSTAGVILGRNYADANPAVISTQSNASSTGHIHDFKYNNILKASIDKDGIFQPSGYKSSDGSVGVTGTFSSSDGKTITLKNGLVTSIV
jgi:hypothetical protein